MRALLLATRNRKKLIELQRLLQGLGIKIINLDSFKDFPDVKEDKDTFRDNAIKKSTEISKRTDSLVVSDDSGLEVWKLNGVPGVRSARYAGSLQDDDKNIAKLLKRMQGFKGRDRRARFRCFICISRFGKVVKVVNGAVEGKITEQRLGESGFGYDSVFIPKGYRKTFAQMNSNKKDQISHRSIALKGARSSILEYFQKYPL